MTTIVSIVEGDGEVLALPVLLRRLAADCGVFDLQLPAPIRVKRDQFLRRDDEFRRMLLLATQKAGPGAVLVLLDADDDCPAILAASLKDRARLLVPLARVLVVIANREFEGWFLAAAESLAGKRQMHDAMVAPADPDGIRNAKGWLSERKNSGRYREVSDQAAFAQLFDMALAAKRSRSFRKLLKECSTVFGVTDPFTPR